MSSASSANVPCGPEEPGPTSSGESVLAIPLRPYRLIACVTGPSTRPTPRCPTVARAGRSGCDSWSSARPTANGQGARLDTEIAALVAELNDDGIVVRDPERGLIDFPRSRRRARRTCSAGSTARTPSTGGTGPTPASPAAPPSTTRPPTDVVLCQRSEPIAVSRCGGRRHVARGRGRRRRCRPR